MTAIDQPTMTALEKNQNITALLALSLWILLSLHVVLLLLLLLLIATNLFQNSIKLLPMSELVYESDRIQKQELGAFLINCLLLFQKNQASCKWSNKFLASEASRYCPDNYVPKTLKKSQSLNCEKLISCLPEAWDMKKNTTCNCSYIATIEKETVFFSCRQQKNCVPLSLHCLFHDKGFLLHRKTVNSWDLMCYSLDESFPSRFSQEPPTNLQESSSATPVYMSCGNLCTL